MHSWKLHQIVDHKSVFLHSSAFPVTIRFQPVEVEPHPLHYWFVHHHQYQVHPQLHSHQIRCKHEQVKRRRKKKKKKEEEQRERRREGRKEVGSRS